MDPDVVHVAAPAIAVPVGEGDSKLWHVRQTCSWCGTTLIDRAGLTDAAAQAHVRMMIPTGSFARRDGGVWWVPIGAELEQLPTRCTGLDPSITAGDFSEGQADG